MKPISIRAFRQVFAAAETMKDSSSIRAIVIAFENLDRFRLRFARVNDHREIQLARGAELPFENVYLHVAR